jgi:hypothetical protein
LRAVCEALEHLEAAAEDAPAAGFRRTPPQRQQHASRFIDDEHANADARLDER